MTLTELTANPSTIHGHPTITSYKNRTHSEGQANPLTSGLNTTTGHRRHIVTKCQQNQALTTTGLNHHRHKATQSPTLNLNKPPHHWPESLQAQSHSKAPST